jgi:hypothetical protein
MAATITAISGPYYGQWNGEYMGVTEDGFELEHTFYAEAVRGDNMGDSIQDEIGRGADMSVSMTLVEFAIAKAVNGAVAAGNIYWPTAATGLLGVMGDVATDLSSALVLTNVNAAAPAAGNPTSITFGLAKLANNFPVRMLFASRLRRLPLRMQCYPQAGAGAGYAASYNEANFWYTST